LKISNYCAATSLSGGKINETSNSTKRTNRRHRTAANRACHLLSNR
jgi:hypothetical protein